MEKADTRTRKRARAREQEKERHEMNICKSFLNGNKQKGQEKNIECMLA